MYIPQLDLLDRARTLTPKIQLNKHITKEEAGKINMSARVRATD